MKIAKSFPKILGVLLTVSLLIVCLCSAIPTASADDVVYTAAGETYHELQNFDASTGGAPVNSENGYSSGVHNTSGRSMMFTVPAGDVVNVTEKNPSYPHFTFTANAEMANVKYLQFWVKNTSVDPVYIYNMNILQSGTYQYRLLAGADVQLIDENNKAVVDAGRWSYVTIGTTITKSRALKIPANFTGYVRIPLNADCIQVIAPSGSEFDTAKLAQANTINFRLGSIGSGGRVYFDDLGFVTGGEAAKPGAKFADVSKAMTYTDATGNTMAYRLYLPEGYDSFAKYPVVLYLHGNGFQGDDNLKQVTGEIGEPLDELVYPDNRNKYPAIIVAPQCPTGDYWVNTTFNSGSYSVDSVAETDAMKMVLGLMDEILTNYSVDKNRVYAMGVSMGAFGCWDMMIRHPGLLTAAVPMMGAGDPTKAAAIGNTAVWAFHDAGDSTVPVSGSQEMVAALQAVDGTNVTYTEYTGVGHAAYRFAVSEEKLLPWMFAQGDIYAKENETYTSISGFEVGETAISLAAGAASSESKNTGAKGWKVTVGDNTNVNTNLTFNPSPQMGKATHLQFWINNTTDAVQYLAGMNLQKAGSFQFNIPSTAKCILIADGTTTEQVVSCTNVRISGLGTIRVLPIPAGFCGYVRISLAQADLEIKSGTYGETALNSVKQMSLYVGNTSTGGNLYFDDFGYVTPYALEENPFADEITITRTHFSADEAFSTALGTSGTTSTSKENGYFDASIAAGKYYVNPVITTPSNEHMDAADYVQFHIKNDSAVDLYINNFNMLQSADSTDIRYRFNTSAQVWSIADGSATATPVSWVTKNISGVSSSAACITIPAGFSGMMRFSLDAAGIEKRNGTSYEVDKVELKVFNFLLCDATATGASVVIDDLQIVDEIDELPAVVGAQIRTSDNNLRFVMTHNQAMMEALAAEYAAVEYGTVVVNADAFGAGKKLELTDKTSGFGSGKPTTLVNKSAFVPEGWAEQFPDNRVYSFTITGVNTDAKKATAIAVRAFIKVTDENGDVHVIYSADKYMHGGYQTTYNAVEAATAELTGE
ncbi:MAG: hypothetical protein IJE00_08615 [Clostridia bacterium]|nr:hypothetical protein [Clostridia bacterium]